MTGASDAVNALMRFYAAEEAYIASGAQDFSIIAQSLHEETSSAKEAATRATSRPISRTRRRSTRSPIWPSRSSGASTSGSTTPASARSRPLEVATLELYRNIMEVNATGTWLGCRAAARVMRAQERVGRSRGRIINVGSIDAVVGQGGMTPDAASKGAVHAMTRELAIELAPDFINVNVIAPGVVTQTTMGAAAREFPEELAALLGKHPWPELGSPSDVAAVVAFLASDAAAWITGATLPVDGGYLAA